MRPATLDSYQTRLERVLTYIHSHLDEPLTMERLADIACLSPFHFHRIFSAFLGETVNVHVRRIRLEQAALRITGSGENVTEAALSVGYETPAAFARAFRGLFGISPSAYRKQHQTQLFSLAGQLTVEEISAMKPEIRELQEMKVLFVRKTGPYAEVSGKAWEALMKFAYQHRLLSPATLCIGIGYDDPSVTPEEQLRYDACITFTGTVQPEAEVGLQTVAGGRYAVFLHKGAYTGLSETYRSIYAGWLPNSGYTLREVPCFEKYLNRDPRRTKPENLRTEIWLPVG
jgi:AraC family transcriptional regulator